MRKYDVNRDGPLKPCHFAIEYNVNEWGAFTEKGEIVLLPNDHEMVLNCKRCQVPSRKQDGLLEPG